MTVAVSLVRGVVDELARTGADVGGFLAWAGLEPSVLDDPSSRIELALYDRLQERAVELTGDPAFGLHMGEHASIGSLDLVGHLTSQCRTLRDALDVLFTFYRLVTDVPRPSLVDEGARVRIVYHFVRSPSVVCNRLRAEFGMTRMLMIGRIFAGASAQPEEVWFEHAKPSYESEYRRLFGGRERFEQSATGMVLSRELLDREQRYWDPRLYSALRGEAEQALRRLDRQVTVAERVRETVLAAGLDARPTLASVASELAVTPRALRRMLDAEQTSFARIADDARAEMARRLLQEAHTTIQEAAFRMGFADVSSFHRSFKRWTGQTPAAYRESLDIAP